MNEEFILPRKWCITTTKKSNNVIKDWLINKRKQNPTNDYSVGNHYCIDEKFGKKYGVSGWMSEAAHKKEGYTEINFEQFKKHVLYEDFVLPRDWCIRITEENIDIFNSYRKKLLSDKLLEYTFPYKTLDLHSVGKYLIKSGYWNLTLKGHTEITLDQFNFFVLEENSLPNKKDNNWWKNIYPTLDNIYKK